MNIAVGYELIYQFPQPTPMLLMLNVHYSRAGDILVADTMTISPDVPISAYRDGFGNWCSRLVAPAGRVRIAGAGTVADSGLPDPVAPDAWQHEVQDLPDDTLLYLLGSRYCETDALTETAWALFGNTGRRAGRGCRRCAILCTGISPSTTSRRGRPARRCRRIRSASACAGIMRIWRWRSAGA